MEWHPRSWRGFKISQQPKYPDLSELKMIEQNLASLQPLVCAQKIRELKATLHNVSQLDNHFIINAGNCAEEFTGYHMNSIKEYLMILTQMAEILTSQAKQKVVLIGRFAGQFAKPRSELTEQRGNTILPNYQGDMINEIEFTKAARTAKPLNLLKAYEHASRKMEYLDMICCDDEIRKIYISHEALLLNYEEAMTRNVDGEYYNLSAHLIWIGNRTRNLNESHVEYVRGVANPVAVKIGAGIMIDELLQLIHKINPQNKSGKLILIARIGSKLIAKMLPKLMRATKQEGCEVIWICDPMHGNTIKLGNKKIRKYRDIIDEIRQFFEITRAEQVIPKGIHLEMSEQNIQECDIYNPPAEQRCDPRLNKRQSLELADFLSKQINLTNIDDVSS